MRAIQPEALAEVLDGHLEHAVGGRALDHVCIDSRRARPGSVFFALPGSRADGHDFVPGAAAAGALSVVSKLHPGAFPQLRVDDPRAALQTLAAHHRGHLGQVLAITGSNGKTIVKDALVAQLSALGPVAASPQSYNSSIGVPLSLLGAPAGCPRVVIEVGVSHPGAAPSMRRMVQPSCGILTNIGLAHIGAFHRRSATADEKLALFRDLPADGWLLIPADEPLVEERLGPIQARVLRVGPRNPELPWLEQVGTSREGLSLRLLLPDGGRFAVRVFTHSRDIVTDLMFAASAAWLMGVRGGAVAEAIEGFRPPPTCMEIWRSPEGVTLVNDACSSDPMSVAAALRATEQIPTSGRRTFVFGGMRELGRYSIREHRLIGELAANHGFQRLVLVGGGDLDATEAAWKARGGGVVERVETPEGVAEHLDGQVGYGDVVLFKGPRHQGILEAAKGLSGSIVQRRSILQLTAVSRNVTAFRRLCGPSVQVLAMVKALAYGTDLVRLAYWMNTIGVEVLGVSSVSEGVAVRRAGITLPILVFLPERDDCAQLLRFDLTPVVYSRSFGLELAEAARQRGIPAAVHLKVDTGMGRLGVAPDEALPVARDLEETGWIRIRGLLTHFAVADEAEYDDFSRQQLARFEAVRQSFVGAGFDQLTVHACNTAAAARFPEAHYDLIRVGLGLYGIYPSPDVAQAVELELALGVVSRIAEVKTLPAGHFIGYGATFRAEREMTIGLVPFGYYDGLPRSLSNRGHVLIGGRAAPICGRISMDMMVVDLTELPNTAPGAEVLLYGTHNGHTIRPEEAAGRADTIAYELISRLGRRVQRVFVDANVLGKEEPE